MGFKLFVIVCVGEVVCLCDGLDWLGVMLGKVLIFDFLGMCEGVC